MPRTPDDTGPVAVAIAQFAPTRDAAANLATVEQLVRAAVRRGADLVVLPEYSSAFIDPFDASLSSLAEDLDGPFTRALTALASELGVHVVAGLLERGSAGDRVRNTVAAIAGSGVVATYRKTHLYDAFGQRESDWVEPGPLTTPETFVCGGVRFGLQTCYDLRFPEVTRTLVDAGADAVLVPSEWVRGPLKEHHWRTLLQARAIENTVYVAGADHPPPLGVGNSVVVDPEGVVVASIGTATDVAVAWIDPETIARVRRANPALALRRYRVVAEG